MSQPLGDLAARRAAHPGQPWRWRPDWEIGHIPSTTRASRRSAWLVAIFWNLISWPVLIPVLREWPRNKLAAMGLLFPLVGLWLLFVATRVSRRWRRYGESWLEMSATPASPGQSLRGTIHVRLPLGSNTSPATSVLLQLTCLERTISTSSSDTDVSEPIRWRDEHTVAAIDIERGPEGATIPVAFDVPDDALETTAVDGTAPGVFWVLTARASVPGVDLHEEYDVPVYRTSETAVGTARPHRGRSVDPQLTESDLARSGVRVTTTGHRAVFDFRGARNASFLAGMTAFTLIWTGALWLQHELDVPWIIQAVTFLCEVLFVVVCLDLWLGHTTVAIEGGHVSRRYTMLGLGRTRRWHVDEIKDIVLRIGSQTQGRTGVPYYDVRALLRSGRLVTLGPRIRSKREAEWLAARMRSATIDRR